MRASNTLRAILLALSVLLLLGAGDGPDRAKVDKDQAVRQVPQVRQSVRTEPVIGPEEQSIPSALSPGARQPLYNMNRFSVHSGGDADATSTNLRAGVFVGEAAVGRANSASYKANLGFWWGQSGATVCPIALVGDVNLSGGVSATDVIYIVNYALRGGPAPLPCEANGDSNCSGGVNTTDAIVLVNYVFRAGPPPCDVCALIPGTWSCP